MLRFCINPECENYEGFIPSHSDECPECGENELAGFRRSTVECETCGESNPLGDLNCWRCESRI